MCDGDDAAIRYFQNTEVRSIRVICLKNANSNIPSLLGWNWIFYCSNVIALRQQDNSSKYWDKFGMVFYIGVVTGTHTTNHFLKQTSWTTNNTMSVTGDTFCTVLIKKTFSSYCQQPRKLICCKPTFNYIIKQCLLCQKKKQIHVEIVVVISIATEDHSSFRQRIVAQVSKRQVEQPVNWRLWMTSATGLLHFEIWTCQRSANMSID